jgi:hypothetical protein
MRDWYAERDTRAHRHHRDKPDIKDDEPLDVQPLQFEMPDEDMHEAYPKAEAEDEVEGDSGSEDEGEEVESQNQFEGQPDPDVFPGGPSDKSVLTEYERHIAICIYANVVSYGLIMQLYLNGFVFLFMA